MAAHLVSVPPVAIELNTDVAIKTASAYEGSVSEVKRVVPQTPRTTTEAVVREYFADIPIMISVAYCESEFTQVDPATGSTYRGKINPRDLGVMQINEYYHDATADALGIDLHTLEGNLAYARYLYNTQGTQPWSASRPCWGSGSLAMK